MNDQQFLKNFEQKVKQTIQKHSLCSKREKIIVAVSGGKDSTTILYLLKKFGYPVEALIIDLLIGPWSQKNLDNIKEFCRNENIKLHIINLRKELGASMCFFRSNIQSKVKLNNCLICGIIKRWLLNQKARQLKAKKLATGHNLDDEAENFLMNLLKNNLDLNKNLGPVTGTIKDKKFVPRIKPLYFCLNQEIKRYSQLKNFPVLYQPCPCRVDSFRKKIREQIDEIEKNNPSVKENIVQTLLKILPQLKKKNKAQEKIKYCQACGEPARKQICKMCELIQLMR